MKRNKILSILLLTVILINCSALNFREKLNNAVKKAKEIYKKKFGKDKTWHFLGYDAAEYPGTNQELRKIQKEKWQKYYDCLIKQENNFGVHGSIIPEAVLAIEGESIKLDCKVCISPSESEDIDSIEWEWSHESGKYLEPLEYDEHTLLSPEDKVLHLYNIGHDHVGQYVCKLGKQLTAPYFLTVVNTDEPHKKVHPKTWRNGPYSEIPWRIHSQIMLDTTWTDWSPCSICDKIGKRHKYGHCTIIYLNNVDELNDPTIAQNNSNKENIDAEDIEDIEFKDFTKTTTIISKIDTEFLRIFKYGIPCRSHILPNSLKNIDKVKERQSEIMIGYCKKKCPKNDLYIVKDKKGNIIETANNSDGVYSMLQGLPPIDPPVERRLQFEDAGKDIVLSCPGNLNSESPISWQIRGKNVVPLLLSKESGGRLFMSITDRIHIKKTRKVDSGIYSCWQDQKLAGTIRLVVEKRIKLNFNHHITLIGIAVILLVFMIVYFKAFLGRKHVKGAQ